MSKTMNTSAFQAPELSGGAIGALVDGFSSIAATALGWNRRAMDRARLRDMPEHLLRDMGITRQDAEIEAGKPFWKA